MDTIGKYISGIKNSLKATGQEAFLPNRFVYHLILKHARWLTKRLDSGNVMTNFNAVAQTLELVELEEVDSLRSLKVPVETGITWRRTSEKLPDMFIGLNGPLIKEITTLDFHNTFKLVDLSAYRKIARSPRRKYFPQLYAVYENGYLYFADPCLSGVGVTAAFETDISHLNDESLSCVPMLQRKLPIPGKLLAELESQVKQSDLAMMLNIPQDPQEDNKNIVRT